MCGICGIIDFSGKSVNSNLIKSMTDSMVHRGPDDDGVFTYKNVGLGMRRLSIIDLHKGKQPISNEDDSIIVVLNGEIYNHIELRKELLSKGHVFKTNSDTEVLVHLYEEYGYESVKKLNGMFAFTIFDKKNNSLWIVRDRLGIKPLYYSKNNNKIIFSSDIKSISKYQDQSISHVSLLKYFGLAYIPTPHSIYNGVEKLSPGHYLIIKNNKIIKKKYWELPTNNNWRGNLDNAKEEFLELINDSIKLRFRSDVPLGLFLSGGLDSSGLVALASKIGYDQLNTLTIDFIGKKGNDNLFANIISNKFKTNHKRVEFNLEEFKNELDKLIPFLDEPISDSAVVPTYVLSKIAADEGIKVLLSGAGGDELFGGYGRYYQPKYFSPRWVSETLPIQLRNVIGFFWKKLNPQRGIRTISPAIAYGLECSGADISFFSQIMNDHSIKSILSVLEETYEKINDVSKDNYTQKRMSVDVQNYLLDDILSLTDKATMAASVEGRVPFLDHRLVEFSFSIPNKINQLNSQPKGLFIEIMKNLLPNELLNRKKEGFNAPTSNWMFTSAGTEIKNELLESIHPILKDLINVESLEKSLLKNNKTSGNSIFAFYILNRWLQINN